MVSVPNAFTGLDASKTPSLPQHEHGTNSFRPFFKKSETFHGPNEYLRSQYEVSHDPGAFGTSGPIQISYSEEYSESHALWHRTLNNLGIETNPAHVTGSNVGVWTNINAVDPRTAARCYATSYPARIGGTAKLHILCGASVERVVLRQDGGRVTATGVILTVNGKQHEASVSREVILSCGSIGSPHLLELSGIGKRSILEEAGIPQLVDSPMVGENLQEHLSKINTPSPRSFDASTSSSEILTQHSACHDLRGRL